MLRRYGPGSYDHLLLSDSETESDDNLQMIAAQRKRNEKGSTSTDKGTARSKRNGKGRKLVISPEKEALLELAKKYQNHMKIKAIPNARLEEAVFVNWQGLAKTLKRMLGQPLHYLTYKLCKEWDRSRFGSADDEKPLGAIINWRDAEATIWKIEEFHRLCTSPYHLAMLWTDDPEYRAFVDEVIPSP